ncbi:protein kinase domain-containing protein [Bradymonas sediminis]|uniref:non-specific serine/threonine protein kinase n=1 Tax=Bradymonas sediminis TaxID=1548548 RepID=A0A2Z4FMU5_9DELT|nr:AAA family ATPase [Bradymonas sediminis]AWV90160.1 hypothetical protein DN745_12780 [Bradymonas sediminis]TDP75872.1 protein kinase-like protein [Bradymonas sediminis]
MTSSSDSQNTDQPAPEAPSDPFSTVSPRYRFLRVIGDGLMGEVFEMLDAQTQESVAARLITHALPREPQKFTRTLDSLSRIEHPHLVRFVENIERDGLHYVVSEFAPGVDLMTYLRQPPTAEELVALEQREDIADAGITDTHEAAHTGPIEIAVDYDAEQDAAPVEAGEHTPAPSADADANDPSDAPHTSPESTLDTPDSEPSLDLSDLISQEFTAPAGTGLGEESASEIVESLVEDSPANRQDTLMLVLLRLDRILPQIIDALEYLHRFKKHHGDLKPANILVDHAGRCMLVDYGIVQELRMRKEGETDAPASVQPGESGEDANRANAVFGPPSDAALAASFAYRAPESLDFDETEVAGPPADLYALGCVLFEAVSNRQVFYGSAAEIRDQQLNADPPPISEVEPYCPATWADVIHGLLAKDPRRRASLNEVRSLLEHSESYAIDIPASALPARDLFLGRTEVIDSILKRFKNNYHQKRLGVSILEGPPGIGKTAVSQAVSYLLSRRGWLVLSGKCYNRESLIYQGWDEIAAQLAKIFEDLPAELRQKIDRCRRRSATLFPVLRLPGDEPVGQMSRLDAIDNFRSLLRRVATQRPILLLIDDLQWASWDTTSLLLDLIGDPKGLSCMVLGTWTLDANAKPNAPAHPMIAGLESAPAHVNWVELGGFSRDDAREYVLSAGEHLSLDEQQCILERGELNPLLLEELIYETRHSPSTLDEHEYEDEPQETDAAKKSTTGPQPVTERPLLDHLISERLDALSRRNRFVLELLSVASIPLSSAIISTILDDEFDTTDLPGENSAMDALDHLMGTRFVEPVRSHQWNVTYSVIHNSHRKLILDQLRDQRYAHLCKCIAEGIRRCWPSAEELRFEYLLRAGLNREAADSAMRATAEAERRFAYNRAAKLWRWLTENAQYTSLSPSTNPQVEHARLERLAHRYEHAHNLFHAIAENTPSGLRRAGFYCDEFEACVRAAHHAHARLALSNALANFDEGILPGGAFAHLSLLKDRARLTTSRWSENVGDSKVDAANDAQQLRAQIYSMVLDLHDLLMPADIAAMRTRLALLASETKDARIRGLDRLYMARHASLSGSTGRNRRVERWLNEAADLFAMAQDNQLRGLCEIFRVDHHRLHGEFDRAEEHLEAAAKFFRNAHLPELRQRYRLRLSYARLLGERGNLKDANFSARQAMHFWRGDRYVMLRVYQILLPNALLAGRTQRAEALLDACARLISDVPSSLTRVWLARMDAQLNIALGRAEVSVGHLDVLAEEMHASGLIKDKGAAAMLHLTLGQSLAALAERERSLIHNRRTDTLERLSTAVRALHAQRRTLPPAMRAEAARLRCRYYMLRDNPKKGLRILENAVSRLTGYPNPIEWAKCLEARAQLLDTLESSKAPALAAQAMDSYARFGAHIPLFLEGWPLATHLTKRSADPG